MGKERKQPQKEVKAEAGTQQKQTKTKKTKRVKEWNFASLFGGESPSRTKKQSTPAQRKAKRKARYKAQRIQRLRMS